MGPARPVRLGGRSRKRQGLNTIEKTGIDYEGSVRPAAAGSSESSSPRAASRPPGKRAAAGRQGRHPSNDLVPSSRYQVGNPGVPPSQMRIECSKRHPFSSRTAIAHRLGFRSTPSTHPLIFRRTPDHVYRKGARSHSPYTIFLGSRDLRTALDHQVSALCCLGSYPIIRRRLALRREDRPGEGSLGRPLASRQTTWRCGNPARQGTIGDRPQQWPSDRSKPP